MEVNSAITVVEGVGDEVVYTVIALLISFIIISGSIFYMRRQHGGGQAIHSESQASVAAARDRLRRQSDGGQMDSRQTAGGTTTHAERNCPICISGCTYSVETNCGHIFCGLCMTTYWQYGNWLGAMRCPVCRQQVSILLKSFTADEVAAVSDEKTQIIRNINMYNRRFSGEPVPWLDYLRDLPILLRHLASEFLSVSGMVLMFRLRILLCLLFAVLYVVSPFDLIPEAAFGVIGLLDDIFIVLLITIYLSMMYRRYVAAADD